MWECFYSICLVAVSLRPCFSFFPAACWVVVVWTGRWLVVGWPNTREWEAEKGGDCFVWDPAWQLLCVHACSFTVGHLLGIARRTGRYQSWSCRAAVGQEASWTTVLAKWRRRWRQWFWWGAARLLPEGTLVKNFGVLHSDELRVMSQRDELAFWSFICIWCTHSPALVPSGK